MVRDPSRDRIAHRGGTVGAAAVGGYEPISPFRNPEMERGGNGDRAKACRIATGMIAIAGMGRADSVHEPSGHP